MDDKVGRRFKLRNLWRRRKDTKTYLQLFRKFLSTHKHSFFASILVLVMIVLLFGIFSFFTAPTTNTAPSGVTVVGYSNFVGQVKAGNVIGVSIRGNEINALLATPVSAGGGGANVLKGAPQASPQAPTALSSAQRNADLVAWNRYINASTSSSWSTNSSPPFDSARIIYTLSPASGDASLSALLLSNNVVVSTQPVAQTPGWLSLIWRFAPFLLLIVILLFMLAPRNGGRSTRGMDERINQIGKSRARRFERDKENTKPATTRRGVSEKPRPAAFNSVTPSSSAKPRVALELSLIHI